jgi:hypothetical protein
VTLVLNRNPLHGQSLPAVLYTTAGFFLLGIMPMTNLAQMFKQAQEMQSKMKDMQEALADVEVTGSSGGGMCEVTLNGHGEAQRVHMDPALVTPDDVAVMEDLIVAAINDAKAKVQERMREKMSELTGGLTLPPGFQLPF